MSFFADPSFFIFSAATIVVAAILGLCERPIRHFGFVVSILFLIALFFRTPEQAVAALVFLAIAMASALWLRAKPDSRTRFYLSVAFTIAPLVCYKVSAVFDESLLGFVGISYITFKAVQVLMETHDGLIKREDMTVVEYLYFLLFFPTFESGPIDRSRRFVADIRRVPDRDEYAGMLARGILLLLAGMVYKIVLASFFQSYYNPEPMPPNASPYEWFVQMQIAYAYAGYLFFDFAGYSLMAMGLGYCLGVRVPRNFRAPFASVDMIDFWNRWHITLSTWLRDFVFMRFTMVAMKHKWFKSRLLTAQCGFMINMTLMGFWHGITPDYICYGLFHGVLLALTEAWQKKSKFYKKHRNAWWYKLVSWFITMQLVIFSFALFSGQVSLILGGA